MKNKKIVFGLSLPIAQKIKESVETALMRKYPEIQSVSRYRKEGILQYAKQQEDILIIMEEKLQNGNPYTAEEIQQLTDLGNNRIILLMDRGHMGDSYVKALYCCGIYDALYLDEAEPKAIIKLAQQGRNNEQARKYYGIRTLRDAEKAANIVNEMQLGVCLEYIEAETDSSELDKKYRFVSTRLGAYENCILAANLAKETAWKLRGNEIFEFYRIGNRERRHLFQPHRREKKPKFKIQQAKTAENQSVPIPAEQPTDKDADILSAIDRFWTVNSKEPDDNRQESDESNLLMELGGYLKTIDK